MRLCDEKDYTLVLDFIGNYQKNYFVPIALSGDRSYVKDNLRKIVKEGSTAIPGCSTVSFDHISEGRIFAAIDGGKFSSVKLIREEYQNLKQILGRIPSLLEFDDNQAMDPLIMFKAFDSYHAFLDRHEPAYRRVFTADQKALLKFVSKKLAAGKRAVDLLLLDTLTTHKDTTRTNFFALYRQVVGRALSAVEFDSALRCVNGEFNGGDCPRLIECSKDEICRTEAFEKMIEHERFKKELIDVLSFGLSRFRASYSDSYEETAFVLNAKYTYEEVCLLLNWEKNINGQNIGGYKYDASTNTYPVFINYDKAPDISDTIKYEDRFVSEQDLIAISKQPRSLDSPEIVRLRNSRENGMKTYLFVRKNKDDKDGGKEFYFLGEMRPTGQFEPITIAGKSAVEITYRLTTPVRADLYDYMVSSFE